MLYEFCKWGSSGTWKEWKSFPLLDPLKDSFQNPPLRLQVLLLAYQGGTYIVKEGYVSQLETLSHPPNSIIWKHI